MLDAHNGVFGVERHAARVRLRVLDVAGTEGVAVVVGVLGCPLASVRARLRLRQRRVAEQKGAGVVTGLSNA